MVKPLRRSSGCCWLLGVLAAAILALTAFILKPEPGLLDDATRLVKTDSWVWGFGSYFWESDHSVLTFRKQPDGVRAVTVDLTNGVETPRIALSDDIVTGGTGVVQWRLSPDGRFLLWRGEKGGNTTWIASTLAGSRLRSWPDQGNSFGPYWLADGRSWVESHMNWLSGRQSPASCTLHPLSGRDRRCAPIPGPYYWPIGVTPDNQVVELDWSWPGGTNGGRVAWYVYSLTSPPILVEQKSVPMPKTAYGLVEAELSPEGGRIACLVQYAYLSPLEQLLQQFLPGRIHPHEKVGLWIIRKDGRGTRLIGSEEGGAAFGLLWTPDGKRVSFIDHRALYTVRAGMP